MLGVRGEVRRELGRHQRKPVLAAEQLDRGRGHVEEPRDLRASRLQEDRGDGDAGDQGERAVRDHGVDARGERVPGVAQAMQSRGGQGGGHGGIGVHVRASRVRARRVRRRPTVA